MGLCWDYVGIMLGLCWDYVGIVSCPPSVFPKNLVIYVRFKRVLGVGWGEWVVLMVFCFPVARILPFVFKQLVKGWYNRWCNRWYNRW